MDYIWTVNDLYTDTKAKYFEKTSSTIYDPYLIPNVNRIIGELFKENNMERMFNGKAPLERVPYVKGLDDKIVFEEKYARDIMPLGLAAYFYIDDDLNKYSLYITDYKNERIMNQKIVPAEVIDGFAK